MFDKYLCKKIGKKNISIADITYSIVSSELAKEFGVIILFFVVADTICRIAEFGLIDGLLSCAGGVIFGIINCIILCGVGSFIHVASCPLKKQE